MCSQACPCQDKSGFSAGLFFGLVIGGALGYLLSTDKGKELLQTLKSNAEETFESLSDNPDLQTKLHQAKEALAQLRSTNEKPHSSSQTKSKKPRFFQRAGTPLKP